MKKLILILAIFAGIQASGRPLVYNHVDFKYTPFIYSVCDELGIESKNIALSNSPNGIHGFVKVTEHGFVIYVDKWSINKHQIIAHEIYHIYQHILGDWDINEPTTINGVYASKKAIEIEKKAKFMGKYFEKKYKK